MNYHITIIIECISILFLNMVLWSLMLPHVAPCCPQIAKMIGRCEAEASGWRGRDPHISLVPRCANPLWANLTKRCIQYTLTRTHIDIHTHIVYLYIHRCITYVQFIMNYMRIYRIFLLKACCMTFIEPGDFHRTISRDMARHANAMRMPCECHANANAGAESLWRGSFRWTAAAGPKCFGRRRTSQFRRSESRCQRCSLDLGKLDKMRQRLCNVRFYACVLKYCVDVIHLHDHL